ncbi:MAG: hypothetical protein IPJ34_19275 [Myxococcales bacterium]|nr:hypothetical protein [Myxococcales bacterium]MBL8716813.1 hypothetical protein [Myxococcales bacterium]
MTSPESVTREIDELFDEIVDLLKNPDVQGVLADRRVNASIAMVAVDGLRAYLKGDKEGAIEDLSVAVEEITQRYAQGAKGEA